MKKQDIMLVAGAVLVIVIALIAFSGSTKESSEKPDLPVVLSGEETGLIKIDYSTYEEKIANNETFIVIIERTGCSFCEKYMPIVEESVGELNIPVYYIDTDDLSSDEFTKLSSSNSYLKKNQWGTPTTLLLYGNVVLDSIGGYVEKDSFLEFINNDIVLDATDTQE